MKQLIKTLEKRDKLDSIILNFALIITFILYVNWICG
jgi:hypothetical protein